MNDAIAEKKAELRKQMICRRELLTPQEVAANSRAIVDRLRHFEPLLDLLAGRPEAPVGLYAAFRCEPDIQPLAAFLIECGARVAFPAIVPAPGERFRHLRFAVYPGGQPLERFLCAGHFGVQEPPHDALMPFGAEMSALIMPGVAFDAAGGRIGFGKAYYDCAIDALPRRPLLIGVAHPFQLCDEPLPMAAHDQRLDYIVLPDRVVVVK